MNQEQEVNKAHMEDVAGDLVNVECLVDEDNINDEPNHNEDMMPENLHCSQNACDTNVREIQHFLCTDDPIEPAETIKSLNGSIKNHLTEEEDQTLTHANYF